MPVTDFECQIVRGQIGRYLGGDLLSPKSLKGLEEHLAECPGCKAIVADRREALMGELGGAMPTHAVVSMPVAQENPLVAALRARAEKSEEPKPASAAPRYAKATKTPKEASAKPTLAKPLALAAVLAVVLVAMSYVSRATGGHGALGTKADTTFAAATLPEAKPEPKAPEPKVPEPTVSKPETAKPKAIQPVAKAPVSAPKPTPVAAKPAKVVPAVPKPAKVTPVAQKLATEKPPVKVVAATKPAPKSRPRARRRFRRSASASVRIYGLDGQPIKP